MDLFLIHKSSGVLIGRGVPPDIPQVVFPGAAKHLPKILRHFPTTTGIIDAPLTLVIDAVVQCLKPPDPDEHVAAFLDCLIPVDKLNICRSDWVWKLAKDLYDEAPHRLLEKAGIHLMRVEEGRTAWKLIRGSKSYWVGVDHNKADRLVHLVNSMRSQASDAMKADQ
jgi:hypothetical protein